MCFCYRWCARLGHGEVCEKREKTATKFGIRRYIKNFFVGEFIFLIDLTRFRFIRKLAKKKDLSDRSAITLLTAKISHTKTAPLYINYLCFEVSNLRDPN